MTSVDGLAAWWTTDVKVDADGLLVFRFGDLGGFDTKVLETKPEERVLWEVVDGQRSGSAR